MLSKSSCNQADHGLIFLFQVEIAAVRISKIGSILSRNDGTYGAGQYQTWEDLSRLQLSSSKQRLFELKSRLQSRESVRAWGVPLWRKCSRASQNSQLTSKRQPAVYLSSTKGRFLSTIWIFTRAMSLWMTSSEFLHWLAGKARGGYRGS